MHRKTDVFIRALKPLAGRDHYEVRVASNLYVRVYRSGLKEFWFKRQLHGRLHRKALGDYVDVRARPDRLGLRLKDAQDMVGATARRLKEEGDFIAAERAEIARRGYTLTNLARDWEVDAQRRLRANTLDLHLGRLRNHILPAQQQETRIALIIANEAYASSNLGRLPGTQRDATLMRVALERSGFQVTLRNNLTRAQMRSELSAFANRLAQLGQGGVGFFYYAGHGVADGPRGRNYLVPVDAQITGVTDLPATSIALNDELDGIALAAARATILVIDACRNTPVALRRGGRGLAPVSAVTDTLIAFSTDAGETATDDGIYARVLSEELQRPGADAVAIFARVQSRVATATNREQRPRFETGLLGEPIVFVPSGASPPPVVSAAPSQSTAPTIAPPPQVTASAARRPGDVFFDCADCPEMVVIPAGTFGMGSPANEAGRNSNEGPQHQVTIRQFAASRTEITFDQWAACVRGGGCSGHANPGDDGWGRGSRPVINVSWNDAQEFVRWVNTQAAGGTTMVSGGRGGAYRLLTEAEWEYAARAGADTPYPWGSTASHEYANYGANRCCSGLASGRDQWVNTSPAGSFPANAFGLFDMHGNVWEWVQDCYAASYSGLPTDGSASETSCSNRVNRGGSWYYDPQYLRSAERGRSTPTYRGNDIGFRVARTLN